MNNPLDYLIDRKAELEEEQRQLQGLLDDDDELWELIIQELYLD